GGVEAERGELSLGLGGQAGERGGVPAGGDDAEAAGGEGEGGVAADARGGPGDEDGGLGHGRLLGWGAGWNEYSFRLGAKKNGAAVRRGWRPRGTPPPGRAHRRSGRAGPPGRSGSGRRGPSRRGS